MKKRICLLTIIAVVLGMCVTSCRDDSTEIPPYGQNDNLAFTAAEKSFAAQFKAVWTAMNSNYGIWDYEKSFGLDWDNVYETYLPEFERLDKDYDKETNPAPDDDVMELYKGVFGPLHDGHFKVQVRNLHTGNYLTIRPAQMRHLDEGEDLEKTWGLDPDISKYATVIDSINTRQKKIEPWSEDEADFLRASIEFDTLGVMKIYNGVNTGPKTKNYLKEELLPVLRESRSYFMDEKVTDPKEQIKNYKEYISKKEVKDVYANPLNKDKNGKPLFVADEDASIYSKANLDANLEAIGLSQFLARQALIKDGIAYFRLDGFGMTGFLNDSFISQFACPEMAYMRLRLQKVWGKWFDNIQKMSKDNSLKGVIIDVRSNGGGFADDFQYLAGALMQQDQCQIGYVRYKDGPGRFDYAPMVPTYFKALKQEHVSVTQPIVALTNICSVSMSEITSKAISYLPNGYTVGKQTWGGLSGLLSGPTNYSYTYASIVGVENRTAFYMYIPCQVTLDRNKQFMEAVGVVPLKENTVDYDYTKDKTDKQLDRAIALIEEKQK